MQNIRLGEKAHGNPGMGSKFLDQLYSKGYYGFLPSESWQPSVNLYETTAAYVVCVDLSGVEKKEIQIDVTDSKLTLRGTRSVPVCPKSDDGEVADGGAGTASCAAATTGRMRVHLMEIDHGAFSREVELPQNVVREGILARHINGLLWIELPKKN